MAATIKKELSQKLNYSFSTAIIVSISCFIVSIWYNNASVFIFLYFFSV